MLSRQLEVSLRLAVSMARQKRHEFLTVEHLLLALLDNDSAVNALKHAVQISFYCVKSWKNM